MLISMNWIQDFVDLSGLDIPKLIHQFTLSTAEVEEIIYKGEGFKDVVSAKICTIEKHPNSQKLHLLKVDAGDQIYSVVCGAPNVEEGMIVPFVKVGGMVNGQSITEAKIAGYISQGMCCSAYELGISADHDGLMSLPQDTALGVNLLDLFPIQDLVFEVDNKSITNRPDLWGHYGIAREFAAISGRSLMPLELFDLTPYTSLDPIKIEILDTENCYRYSSLKVGNIQRKHSPEAMRIRLHYCGHRSINLLADLTNYIMLEMGQPMHAFDCAKMDCIEVQRFAHIFDFVTLDNATRKIDPETLMITSNHKPVAIAGIMGGLETEINENTNTLLLESANFNAVSVRKSSTRLGLRTDASARYEKTIDPEMTAVGICRFMHLLSQIDPDIKVLSCLSDRYMQRYPEIKLNFTQKYVDRYTGISISEKEILKTLSALGFTISCTDQQYDIIVPSWRATKDVTLKADIIEEITRIYGYDNFEIQSTKSLLAPVRRSPENLAEHAIKDMLVERFSLHEVSSYLWCDSKKFQELNLQVEQNVRLLNAMTPEHDTLRNNILPSLLLFVQSNKNHAQAFGLFEIARVIEGLNEDGTCNERKKLGIVLYSKIATEKELFFQLLKITKILLTNIKHLEPQFKKIEPLHHWQHPKNTVLVEASGLPVGVLNTFTPDVIEKIDKKAAVVGLQMDMESFAGLETKLIQYTEPSKYPGIDIDLSLEVKPDTAFSELEPAWHMPDTPLKKVSLIDRFVTDTTNSITLRFSFSSSDKTLSMDEIQPVIEKIISNLQDAGINLRH